MTKTPSRFRWVSDEIEKGSKQLFAQWDAYKHMNPVYRVQIRYPDKNGNPEDPLVLADTSNLQFILGNDSPIIGLWVDKTSRAQNPDKCQVILHNKIEDATVERWIHDWAGIGGKNWLDIWMGYKQPGAIRDEVIPDGFSNLIGSPNYGSTSHIFSGPIVRVDREVSTTAGDRLRITGWDAVHMLQNTVVNSAYWLNQDAVFQREGESIADHLDRLLTKIEPFPARIKKIDEGQLGFVDADYAPAYMGKFYYKLYDDRWEKAVTDYGLKIGGSNKLVNDLKKTKFKWSADLPAKYHTVWDYLQAILDQRRHGLGMLDARVISSSLGKMQVQIFRTWELGDLIPKWDKAGKIPRVALGTNMVDLNYGIEAGNIFNSYDYITPGPVIATMGPDSVHNFPLGQYPWGIAKAESPDYVFSFSAVADSIPKDEKPFIKSLLKDIYIYGPSKLPETIWLPNPAYEGMEPQEEPTDEAKKTLGMDMVNIVKRFYFGGAMGECLAVGSSEYAPGMPVIIGDDREKSLAEKAIAAVTSILKRFGGKDTLSAEEMYRLDDFEDQYFFLWKVRHYMGVGVGYTTKLYWCQERHSEELALPANDVMAQLRQAFSFGEMQRRGFG